MNREIEIRRAVALIADSFSTQAEQLGATAARVLQASKRSQLTGLEAVANSTLKVSDVLDYIKVRIGRQPEWRLQSFGQNLLTYLQSEVRALPAHMVLSTPPDDAERQRITLLLIREFIRQMTAHYEYACAMGGGTV